MTGTPSQIEWAAILRPRAGAEFDRVARAFEVVADNQSGPERADTETILTILAEMRADVMANNRAGYFIREWQEPDGRVRLMIAADARYHAIQAQRAARAQGLTAR